MDSHPVPQNILEVEFKLFGAFTLKQFLKILIGCLFSLAVYFIGLPWYLGIPMMGAGVLVGIGLAIVPNFAVWMSGFVKALFISPRYVWVKKTSNPEVLTSKVRTPVKNDIKQQKHEKKPTDLSEISLEKLLGSADVISRPDTNQIEDVKDTNIDRLLNEVYTEPATNTSQLPASQSQKSAASSNLPIREKTTNEYIIQINQLKKELGSLVKDQHYKEKETELMSRINDLYQEMKFHPGVETIKQPQNKRSPVITDAKGTVLNKAPEQSVFGIIVDKNDKPVANASIKLDNPENEVDFTIVSGADGRFVTPEKLPIATYNVSITHPELKFHSYKIVVGNTKLPAYKLRAR